MPDYHPRPGRPYTKEELQAQADRESAVRHEKANNRRSDARHMVKELENRGPAERLASSQGMTQAQQEMRTKREAARAADRAELSKAFSEKTYERLPQKPPSDIQR